MNDGEERFRERFAKAGSANEMAFDLLGASALVALAAIVAWRRPWRRAEDPVAVEACLESFSADSYLPMLRLADSSDSSFLSAHLGPEQAAKYSRLQRRMLRDYLRGLSRDFRRLHSLATESALRERSGNKDSSLALVEEKMEFIFCMWSLELRLLLSGIVPCVVNPRPLLANVEQVEAKARASARRRTDLRFS